MTDKTENPQFSVCDKCRLSTKVPELLTLQYRSFRLGSSRLVLVCPRCAANHRRTIILIDYIIRILAVVVLVFISPLSEWRGDERSLRTFIEFLAATILFEPIFVFLHEAAHAAVGWAVGLRVFGISIGSGPRLCRFRMRNFVLEIHLLPHGGLCWIAPGRSLTSRGPLILMTAAGMMLHLLVLVLLLCFAPGGFPPSPAWLYSGWWLGLVFVNFGALLMSIIPATYYLGGQRRANDGRLILRLLRSWDSAAQWAASRYVLEIDACLEPGHIETARQWLENGRSVDPNSLSFRIAELTVLGAEKNWEEVCTKARKWRTAAALQTERAAMTTWLAVAMIYAGNDLAEVEALCIEMMQVFPWDPSAQTVCALVSLARGYYDEAESLLKTARTQQLHWAAKAAGAQGWTALYQVKGNIKKHHKWQLRANALDPGGAFKIKSAEGPSLSSIVSATAIGTTPN